MKEKKKFGELLKDNLQKITIAIVSLIYIVQGLFTIAKKDTTIWNIVGSVGLSIVVGIVISSSLNTMGLKDGRRSETFVNSLKLYGETKSKATPYFDKLSSWCDYKNARELENKKKEIIQSAGLTWKGYRTGYYAAHKEKLDSKQTSAIHLADHCKILKINSRELLSDLPNGYGKIIASGNKFGESEKDYKRKNIVWDFINKLSMSIICGLYTLSPLISQENKFEVMASILWNALQIAMWLALGIMKYVNARMFMEEEYRQTHIIQKTEYLNEFIVTMENNPNIIDEYDEDEDINKFIQEQIDKKNKEKELIPNEEPRQREETVSS